MIDTTVKHANREYSLANQNHSVYFLKTCILGRNPTERQGTRLEDRKIYITEKNDR
jgi:hypothetical protein